MPDSASRRSFLRSSGIGLLACVSGARLPAAAAFQRPVPARAVIPAALTPFDSGLKIDRQAFGRHVEALALVPGVTALMINGAAGQDTALSRDERRGLLAEAMAAVGNRTPILAALRETNTIALEDLARDAAAENAHAVVMMPPPDRNDVAWERARVRFQRVRDVTALPMAIYQVNYTTETLVQLAEIPGVMAVKEGSGDPATFERNLRALRALNRGIAVWTTHSRWLLADLAVGADGILSGMGSVAAELQVALAGAVWRSDLTAARRANDRLFPLTQVFYRFGGDAHARMKYALVRLGRWTHDEVRPPLKPLDSAERARIDRALQESGLVR